VCFSWRHAIRLSCTLRRDGVGSVYLLRTSADAQVVVGMAISPRAHSDVEVNVTTAFRQHPNETLWRILWQLLAVATFGLPLSVVVVYSNIFSIWDRIFGTYTATVDFSRLRYGLDGFDDRKKPTVPALLKLPFVDET